MSKTPKNIQAAKPAQSVETMSVAAKAETTPGAASGLAPDAAEDERVLKERVRQLESRVDYLEEQKRFTLDLLENASTLGDFQSSFAQMQDPQIILGETAARVERLLPVTTQAFYLTDERDADFRQTLCTPAKDAGMIADNVAYFIDKGIFAWALREKRPVFITARDGQSRMLLHVLSTSSRVRGMFLAVLTDGSGTVYDHSLSLLSILMLHTANALESYELYRWVRHINADLESKVQALARSEQELKRHRTRLEDLVKERTGALNDTVAQLKDSLADKDMLLSEVHHRVRNNLQVISSLLNLQAGQSGEERLHDGLMDAQARVRSMAIIHEQLYKSGKSGLVEQKGYLASLCDQLQQNMSRHNVGGVTLQLAVEEHWAEMDVAMPVGLIVNELVTNCFKHGFPLGRNGNIHVSLQRQGADWELRVADDGVGLPPGVDVQSTGSLGFMLVTSLAAQVDGQVGLATLDDGTEVRVVFPDPS